MIKKSLHLNLFIAVGMTAIVMGNAAYSVFQDYESTIADHEVIVRDLASVVADQAQRSVQDADLSLRQVSEVVQAGGSLTSLNEGQHWAAFRRISQRINGIVGLLVVTPNGTAVANSTSRQAPSINVADREYMKILADNDVLNIGPAVKSRIKPGEVVYTVSRRVSDTQGNFMGVVTAGISTSHLTEFYDLLGFKKDPLIVVTRSNGEIMARRPAREEFIGKSLNDTPLFQWRLRQSPEGVFRADNPLDGIHRLFAYKALKDSGLVILVGIQWDVVTAEWRQRTLRTSGITILSVFVIAIAAWWGASTFRRAIKAQADRDDALAAKDEAHQALHHAQRDHLTGLPSRALFLQEADKLRTQCRNGADRMAVMIIDLDGFKGVNDTYGHDKGDEVLVNAGVILHSALRETDVAGRLGGDEFGVCISAPPDHIGDHANRIAGRIVERMAGIGMGIGCSVGVSLCPVSCEELPCALKKADEAMYEAKKLGKNQFVVWGGQRRSGEQWQAAHEKCSC